MCSSDLERTKKKLGLCFFFIRLPVLELSRAACCGFCNGAGDGRCNKVPVFIKAESDSRAGLKKEACQSALALSLLSTFCLPSTTAYAHVFSFLYSVRTSDRTYSTEHQQRAPEEIIYLLYIYYIYKSSYLYIQGDLKRFIRFQGAMILQS